MAGRTLEDLAGAAFPADSIVLSLDGIGLVATVGFFVPAAIVVMILAVIIIRDRRSPEEDDEISGAAPDERTASAGQNPNRSDSPSTV